MFFLKQSLAGNVIRVRAGSVLLRHLKLATVAAMIFCAGATLLAPTAAFAEDRKVERRVPPIYPELAKRMKISGIVKISATVAPSGSVVKAETVSGNRMLAPAAEDAVRRWKFVAGPDESVVEVEVNFQMSE